MKKTIEKKEHFLKAISYKLKAIQGFTLIEMLVATALFSVVMMLAVGALLSMIEGNNKAQALKLAMNNINFAIEGISRTMRVGTLYRCSTAGGPTPTVNGPLSNPRDCSGGGRAISFEPFGGNPADDSNQYIYRHANTGPGTPGRIDRSTDGGLTFIPITAPEVDIEELTFYVVGSEATVSDQKQPRVVMIVKGTAGDTLRARTNFNIQTTVSQRILDLP